MGAAGPGADPWVAPSDTLALPADCEALVAVSAVRTALGVSRTLVSGSAAGGWSLPAGADVNAGIPSCGWFYQDADATVGWVRYLPAGVWAFTEAFPALATPSSPTPLALTGLGADDEAWIRCAAGNAECTIDLVIGGNWVEFDLGPEEGLGPVTADRVVAGTEIAQTIVDNLRP